VERTTPIPARESAEGFACGIRTTMPLTASDERIRIGVAIPAEKSGQPYR
jgi:hypothetical protein